MPQPIAEVVALSGRTATVSVDAGVGCARCAAGKGCGAAFLAMPGRERRFDVPIPAGLDLAPGDRVSLLLSPRHLLQASIVAYGWPLAAMVAVPAVAEVGWGPLSEVGLVGLAIGALAGTVLAGRRRLRQDPCLERFVPSIGTRVARGGQATGG